MVVMQALVQHMSSPLVAENATHVIAALARDAGCKRILLRYLALQRLTEAMALHVKLPLLHEYALAACVRICDGFAKGLNQFVAMDGAVPLYASMDAHKDILPVALQGCRMMELLTRPASGYVTYFFDSAGIKRLYKAMDRFQSDEQIAAVFSQTMYNFTLKEDYRGPCVGTDGLSRLYAAIRTHLVSRNVLRPAIGALFNVATLPSNIDSVVRTFGMTRLIAVMEAHRYREDLTQACISCFVLLTGAEKHRLSVAQSNACELTIGGIQRHSTDAPLVEQACALLANLAQQQDCVPIMWSKGAAVQLLSAIINFPASEIIACMALRALLGLCSLPACVEYLMGQACAENVLKPLIAMVDCAALQVVGCDVMFRLCTTEEHIMAFFNAGAVTHAYDVMEKHDLLPTAQASAMGLLATMAVVPIVANRIVQTSGLKRVHRALTRHVVSRPALEAGVSALCAFATASDSNRRTMLESDCIDRVFMAMDRMKGSVLLQARACAFIFAMAGLREARSELRSRGAIDRIHRTRVSNPTSDEVITWAGRALQRLTACVVCSVQ